MKKLFIRFMFPLMSSIPYQENTKTMIKKIMDSNVKFKHIVVAQAIEESAWFTSRRAKECKNIFGIKISSHPLQSGRSNRYGCYRSIDDCIKHFTLIQRQAINHRHIKSDADYYRYLRRVYATNPKYVKNVKQIKTKISRWKLN